MFKFIYPTFNQHWTLTHPKLLLSTLSYHRSIYYSVTFYSSLYCLWRNSTVNITDCLIVLLCFYWGYEGTQQCPLMGNKDLSLTDANSLWKVRSIAVILKLAKSHCFGFFVIWKHLQTDPLKWNELAALNRQAGWAITMPVTVWVYMYTQEIVIAAHINTCKWV